MSALHISADLSLPLEAVTNTHLILARRRVGKSYTAAVMAEEMVKAGLPWVALDPTGVWWGLTSSADGKSEGLPVIVVGGPHGHIPLEPSAGKVIANLVIDNPGWYIIDFSRFHNASYNNKQGADHVPSVSRRPRASHCAGARARPPGSVVPGHRDDRAVRHGRDLRDRHRRRRRQCADQQPGQTDAANRRAHIPDPRHYQ